LKNLLRIDPRIKIKPEAIEKPVIIRISEFDEESVSKFSDDISKAHNTGQEIIPIVIDSYGGSIYDVMSIISEIENSHLLIATIVVGKAMSAGALLLTYGTEGYRYVDQNATIMIHEISANTYGKNEDVKSDAKEIARLNKFAFGKMARNCGHKPNYFLEMCHSNKNADCYLTPQQAKKHNLANHVKIPEFITTVTVETKFQ